MGSLGRSMLIAAVLLGLFGILGAALVALTHAGTEERIAQNERDALLHQIGKLVPADSIDNDILADTLSISAPGDLGAEQTLVYRGRKGGEPIAAVLSPIYAKGYAGPIKLIVAVRNDGSLGGVRVISHTETPGLGDKIQENKSDWILDFQGKSIGSPPEKRWKVKKDGGDFDQFTGATITPRNIVAAVKQTLDYFNRERTQLFAQAEPVADPN